MSGRCQESLPEVREVSGGPPESLGVTGGPFGSTVGVRRPFQKYGRGWKALLEVQEGSVGVGWPSRNSGRSR